MSIFEGLRRDARVGWRSLRRTPLITAAAVLSIGLGAAAATAVFSVVDAALFRPPPFPDAGRLMVLFTTRRTGAGPVSRERWSWARSQWVRAHASSFAAMATVSTATYALTGDDPEPIDLEFVSSSYLPVLGVRPMRGIDFARAEEEPATASSAAILGYDIWQRRYGGRSEMLGTRIHVNGVAVTVIGIAPPGFRGLSGRAQLWLPATLSPRLSYTEYLTTNQNFITLVGRLRDGVSPANALSEITILGDAVQRLLPSATSVPSTRFGATLIPLAEARVDPGTRRPVWLLLAASLCLLALACTNVAGLLLGRAASRGREVAIRVATGASRARVVRQLLVESALISTAGGALAVLTALPLSRVVALPTAAARGRNFYGALGEFAEPRIDGRVLAFSVAVCVLMTVAFGTVPALRATRVDLARELTNGGASAGGGSRITMRQLVVGAETMLAVVLLFCGAALAGAWHAMATANLGFEPAHVLTFIIRPSEVRYPPAKAPALIAAVLDAIQSLPDVVAASVDGCAPLGPTCANSTLFIAGRPTSAPGEAPPVLRHYVGPEQFRTLGVPVLRGRAFTTADRADAPRVAIINETAARRFWPDEDPLGKRVWFGGGSSFDRPDSSAEIVGVVGDVAYQALDDHPVQPDFYTPYAQFSYATRVVLVRTRGAAAALVPQLRRAVRRADPDLALFDVQSMDERMRTSWARLAFQSRLITAFAIVAIVLAATGVFALIAHSVTERRREIGIRVALGASAARVLATVGGHGVRPAVMGLLAGLALSAAVGRILSSSVYGVRAADPRIFAAVGATALLVTLAAAYVAGRRALQVPAAEALRL